VDPDVILRDDVRDGDTNGYHLLLFLGMVKTNAVSLDLIVLKDIIKEVVFDVGIS
jgi:hypothetical protein